MSERNTILAMGAATKAEIMRAYSAAGNEFGHNLARRYIFDVAEAIADIAGRAEAASIVYQVADTLVGKLPLEDWKSHAKVDVAAPPSPAPVPRRSGLLSWIEAEWAEWKFLIGFVCGYVAGGWR